MIYDTSKYPYISIIQDLLSIDIKKHDWKKDFIELKNNGLIVKNTDDENKTTFHFVNMEENKLTSISNTGNSEIVLKDFNEDLKVSFFQFKLSCKYSDVMYDYFKKQYKDYIDKLDNIPTLIEACMHIIPPKSCAAPHIDQEHIGEKEETERANLVLSLTTPENSFIKVGDEVCYSKDNPVLAFNAQYIHSAYNYSNEDWVLLILHIPTIEVKEI